MALATPAIDEEMLSDTASRFVNVDEMPWRPTQCPGVEIKTLLEDRETGMLTALFRWQPGAELPLHEHVEVEQTYVLEGSIVDAEGEVKAGNFVWRPRGNRHVARAPEGALVLAFFLRPNKFIDGEHGGQELR